MNTNTKQGVQGKERAQGPDMKHKFRKHQENESRDPKPQTREQ